MNIKRGQLTIFVIVGIVVVLAIIGLVVLFSVTQDDDASQRTSTEYENARNCVSEVVDHAIYYVFLQGGYTLPPEDSEPYLTLGIPVYWRENQSFVPTKASIEREFVIFLEENVPFCFEEDVALRGKVNVRLENNLLLFSLESPINFISSGEKLQVQDFEVQREVYFDTVYRIINTVISGNEQYLGYMPISSLTNEVQQAGFTYEVLEFDTETKMVSIIMPNLDERGPLVYNFVMRYN